MKIFYKPQAIKQLKKLPKSQKKKVVRKLKLIAEKPLSGKPLKGELKNLYSLRAWPYRIIYEIKTGKIIVYSIAHRQSAY